DQAQDISRRGASARRAATRAAGALRTIGMADRREVHVATGKRKTAVARVRMRAGEGKIVVNKRALDDYFGRQTSRMIVHQPFEVTNTNGQYDASVNVGGGGVAAQATAIRHAITP